jgi:UDP-N-acetylglucosamine acyltransferase
MIHPTAIIYDGAEVADGVEIGPYAVIGPHVKIGSGTKIGPHAVIDGWTEIGRNNVIFQMASVGAIPQDLKYKGEETRLRMGDNNTVREFATIHLGTVTGDGETTIGNGNLFMAYSHVAHDCHIGNNVIMANAATLAGHITVDDFANIGGLVAIHQFTRIGAHSMIGGGTLIGRDVPPFTIAATGSKRDAELRGINLIGLKRRGFTDEALSSVKKAYMIFKSDMKVAEALEKIRNDVPQTPEVAQFLEFIEKSERGTLR